MASGLKFGIYPLSAAGTPFGLAVGPEDNYELIQNTLKDLRGSQKLFSRIYLIYTPEWESKMLSLADSYLNAGLLDDLTIGCGDWTKDEPQIDFDGWLGFIRKVIEKYGSHLTSLQITNEPNLSFMEGSRPYIMEALTGGVVAAKRESFNRNLPLKIGFGSVPDSPAAVHQFWDNLGRSGGKAFVDSVDFVGHNFYVDVFEDQPLDNNEISASVERILRALREKDLPAAGIPSSVPIRVTENGWPTGKNPIAQIERSFQRQTEVLETVIRTVYELRHELNISHYQWFGLRDADSSKEDLFHQFGIMLDDYTPKPAYESYKKIIRELGE